LSTPRWRTGARRLVSHAHGSPWAVLAACAALTLLGGLAASRLEFRGSLFELLPRETPEVRELEHVAEKAGGDGYHVLRVRGAAPAALQRFAGQLAPRLEALPEVRYVEYRFDVDFFRQRALLLLPLEQLRALRAGIEARVAYERRRAWPLHVQRVDEEPPSLEALERELLPEAPLPPYLASKDGSELYLLVKAADAAGDLDFASRLVEAVERTAQEVARDHPGVVLDATGPFVGRLEEDAVVRRDLAGAAVLAALLAGGLILLAARRLSALAVVGLPVLASVTLTYAVAWLAIGHLNVITGFLAAILIGLGLEYGVHLTARYHEERTKAPAREALEVAVVSTFPGAFASAITNAAAFYVLLFARFEAFRHFGLLAGTGVLLSMLATYVAGPALLSLAERFRPGPPAAVAPTGGAVRSGRPWPASRPMALGLSVLVFAGYSWGVLPRLEFDSDMRRLKGDSPVTRLDDHISEQLGSSLTPAILLVDTFEELEAVHQAVAEVQQRHGTGSELRRAASLLDVLPREVDAHLAELDRLRERVAGLPPSVFDEPRVLELLPLLEARPFTREELPSEVRRRFEALDGKGFFVLLFPVRANYDTRAMQAWAGQLDEVVAGARARGTSVVVLDSDRVASRIFTLVQEDGPRVLGLAGLVVLGVLLLSLRDARAALLIAGCLALGMLSLAGALHLSGVRLNFINAVVLPNLLAIAVDNALHLYHRYREEGPGSLGHVLRSTGRAAILATLANAAGYGALLVARHEGMRSIGQLALLGVLCTFLATMVLFPSVLALAERLPARQPSSPKT